MTIRATISIAFDAESEQSISDIVGAFELPEGATVYTGVQGTIDDATGIVDSGGNIEPPAAPGMPLTG